MIAFHYEIDFSVKFGSPYYPQEPTLRITVCTVGIPNIHR
jgi:hypothetical protein